MKIILKYRNEAGADDYIDKPIQPKVFVTKIKSLREED